MAVFQDNFNRADAANLGGSWTNQRNSPKIVSNAAKGEGTGDDSLARETATTIGADQYALMSLTAFSGNSDYVGVMVRCTGSGSTNAGYEFITDGASGSGHSEIAKWVNNVYTVIAAVAVTFVGGDIIYCEASGTSIKAKKNGVQIGATQTDSAFASGQPGVDFYNNGAGDNFEGGDLGGGGAVVAANRRSLLGVGT